MAGREEVLHEHQHEPAAVGRVLQSLAPLVLDDVALVVELFLGECVGERRQAVGLEPEQRISRFARRHGRRSNWCGRCWSCR